MNLTVREKYDVRDKSTGREYEDATYVAPCLDINRTEMFYYKGSNIFISSEDLEIMREEFTEPDVVESEEETVFED